VLRPHIGGIFRKLSVCSRTQAVGEVSKLEFVGARALPRRRRGKTAASNWHCALRGLLLAIAEAAMMLARYPSMRSWLRQRNRPRRLTTAAGVHLVHFRRAPLCQSQWCTRSRRRAGYRPYNAWRKASPRAATPSAGPTSGAGWDGKIRPTRFGASPSMHKNPLYNALRSRKHPSAAPKSTRIR